MEELILSFEIFKPKIYKNFDVLIELFKYIENLKILRINFETVETTQENDKDKLR